MKFIFAPFDTLKFFIFFRKIFLWIIIVLTVVLSLLLGVYFLLFERDNLKYTVEEFCKILESRGFTGENEYYRATLYNIDSYDVFYENFNEKNINDAQTPIIYALATVYHRILIAFSGIRIETGIFPFLLWRTIVSKKDEKNLKKG